MAGKNEQHQGYQKFASAQFYENLTKEQYSGKLSRGINALSASRDTLNPMLNAKTLKDRLTAIEYYKYQHGVEHARWPHFFMTNCARHLNRYKFNYGIKAFGAYVVYREYSNYRRIENTQFTSIEQQAENLGGIFFSSVALTAVCLLI